MKLNPYSFAAAALAIFGTHNPVQAVTVDGIRSAGEYTGATVVNQATVSNWNDADELGGGKHEALANLHAIVEGDDLALHLAARVKQRGILLFIDSKSGGQNFIPNNLITFGGEGNYINNLGSNASSGMTFESDFTADYAIRIYGDGTSGGFVNLYDLNAGARDFVGNAGTEVVSKGVVAAARTDGLGTTAIANNTGAYAAADRGVEMKLNLAALGVPSGSQSVKLMVVLVSTDSDYGSNQVLASRTSNTLDIGDGNNGTVGIKSINFGDVSEGGTQTITVPVIGPSSRQVDFSVNMADEISKGFFNPTSNRVKVLFFNGVANPTPGEIYLADGDNNSVYTGSLLATGNAGVSFGEYKFFNTAEVPNFGYEYGANRNFTLGPFDTLQSLGTVTFRANSYSIWADSFAEGQPPTGDKDGDGVENAVEYFMGSNNAAFTPNPAPVNGVVTWPRDPYALGLSFKVEVSNNLSTWQNAADVHPGNLSISGTQVSFT